MGQWNLGFRGWKEDKEKEEEWIVGAMGGVWYLREPENMFGLWDGMCGE